MSVSKQLITARASSIRYFLPASEYRNGNMLEQWHAHQGKSGMNNSPPEGTAAGTQKIDNVNPSPANAEIACSIIIKAAP